MFDKSIVNKTFPEANWNRQTGQAGRHASAQDYVLSQADALTKNCDNLMLNYEVCFVVCSSIDHTNNNVYGITV